MSLVVVDSGAFGGEFEVGDRRAGDSGAAAVAAAGGVVEFRASGAAADMQLAASEGAASGPPASEGATGELPNPWGAAAALAAAVNAPAVLCSGSLEAARGREGPEVVAEAPGSLLGTTRFL